MITVTKGQWFPLTISNVQYGGTDFDMQGAKDVKAALVSSLGTRAELSFTVSAYNELSAVCDGNIAPGKYSVEVTAVGADGRNYRMLSPLAVIEVTSSTTPSGASKARIQGDKWELTADVEIHEGQARTYMSLLEEARQKALEATAEAVNATDKANNAIALVSDFNNEVSNIKTNHKNDIEALETKIADAKNNPTIPVIGSDKIADGCITYEKLSPDLIKRLLEQVASIKVDGQVVFMHNYTGKELPEPKAAGLYAYSDNNLYKSDGVGTYTWNRSASEGGKIYVDEDTAQSYVSDGQGNLLRLDKENSDLSFDVVG